MKKIVLILYTSHQAGRDMPFSDIKYQRCYEALYSLGETMGLHLCRAPLGWYDSGRDLFLDAWEFVDGQWRLSGPIKPDLVYDKTGSRSADDETRFTIISRYRFIDDPAFTRFANDKYETSRRLPQHFKPYQKITSTEEFSHFLATLSDDQTVVIKPVVGSGGQGVHIVSRNEATKLSLSFPIIAQEFIDSSHGIPDITDTYHDLRMVFIGDELVYSYVRTPKEGSLLANIAQGGRMVIVPAEKLPLSLQAIIADTQKLFSVFPQKTYTIDIMFDEASRPWIIEYNTMPGMFFPPEETTTMIRVYTRLLQELQHFLERPAVPHPVSAVIIFTPSEQDDTVPFQKETLRDAYTAFAKCAEREGVKLYRASTEWYDDTQSHFRIAWHWDGVDWVLVNTIVPDVIYDKSAITSKTAHVKGLLFEQFPFINHPEFSHHAGNKLLVSQTFKQCAKPYYRITSEEELARVLTQLPDGLIVIKPEHGNSGHGISIREKSGNPIDTAFPFLIQEFIDSSAGIPGVMKGLHDLRLIFSNEEFLYAYYRTPKAGSYLANLAQGGTQTMISKEGIPPAVWPIVKTVQEYYARFEQKIFTIDLMFDRAGTPWIVELNTMPGLYPDESERPHIDKLYLAIVQALKATARRK
jgi:glutathione synthase/RimK-type ligase-like ATP-grasp enzyme